MYIEAEIPERYLTTVTVGKDVAVNIPMLSSTLQSKVRQTGNYINPNNRSFRIEVNVPNEDGQVKPNLTARLRINDYTNPKALLIPISVISENAQGEQYVYVANAAAGDPQEAIAERKIITTGLTQGDYTEVISGITEGDAIIVEGARTVKDGQEVKILNQ
jgi:RND family efflux transporter MFP subunit